MTKQIRLNAFAMNCVAHQSPGLWTHPRDRTLECNRLPYWIDLAKTLDSGVLLSRDGDGHTAYGKGNDCIDRAIDTYFIEGTPPADGTMC